MSENTGRRSSVVTAGIGLFHRIELVGTAETPLRNTPVPSDTG